MRNRTSDLRTPRSDALRLYFMAKFIVPLLNYQNYHCRVITQYHTMSLKQNSYRVLFLSHTWFKDKKSLKLINRNTCKLRDSMKWSYFKYQEERSNNALSAINFLLFFNTWTEAFFQWGNNHFPLLLCIYCNMIQQQLQIVSICKPFNSHEQPRKKILTIKIQKHCNIKQKSDENKENYQLGDS